MGYRRDAVRQESAELDGWVQASRVGTPGSRNRTLGRFWVSLVVCRRWAAKDDRENGQFQRRQGFFFAPRATDAWKPPAGPSCTVQHGTARYSGLDASRRGIFEPPDGLAACGPAGYLISTHNTCNSRSKGVTPSFEISHYLSNTH